MPSPSTLNDRLNRLRRRLVRRRSLQALLAAAAAAGVILLAIEAVEWTAGLREPAALAVVLSVAGLLLAACAVGVVCAVLRSPHAVSLARAIEERHPEYMDALICAAEREAVPEARRGVLERALIEQVREQTASQDLTTFLFTGRLRASFLAALAVAVALLGLVVLHTRTARKAGFALADRWRGADTGLAVSPGTAEVAEHADFTVAADVLRWEDTARIVFEGADGRRTYPMNSRDGRHHFTFYDLTAPLRYRVRTPALRSPWYKVTVFRPPELLGFRGELRPPAYTGLAPTILEELKDTAAIAGSQVTLHVRASDGAAVTLAEDTGETPFAPAADGTQTVAFTLDAARTFSLVLRDAAGHLTRTRPMTLRAIPDAPPVVDVIEPARDATLAPGEGLLTRARAGDDFGLAEVSLTFSVSGRDRQTLRLAGPGADPAPEAGTLDRDLTVQHLLDAAALGAEAGDVIAYFYTALDNRRPDAQRARSDILFIEVRPDIKPEEMPGGQGPQQQLDIGRLIAETRRLIRLSYDVLGANPDDQPDLRRQLKTGMADLQVETVKVFDQVRALSASSPDPVFDGLAAARNEVEAARDLIGNDLVDDSLPHQERALHHFTRVAQELMKNAASSSQPQDQSSTGDGEGQQSGAQGGKPPKSLKEQMEDLRELARELARLADRQGGMNERYDRLKDAQLGDSEEAELAGSQTGVQADTAALAAQARADESLADVTRAVEGADTAMRSAASSIPDGDLHAALRQGRRAQNGLLAAADLVRQRMRRLAADRIADLADRAQELAAAERSAAEASAEAGRGGEVPPAEREAMRGRQKQLGAGADDLLAASEQTAAEFAAEYPEVAQALAKAAGNARQKGLPAAMKRAENALVYGRFDRAAAEQRAAGDKLADLAQEVYVAADLLPKMSQEELLRALQAVQQGRERLRQAAEGQTAQPGEVVEQTAEAMARLLTELGTRLNDFELSGLGGTLGGLPGSAPPGQAAHDGLRLLDAAARLLQRHLLAAETDRRLQLMRRTSLPPAKYRGLVEEYFKSLSETPQ